MKPLQISSGAWVQQAYRPAKVEPHLKCPAVLKCRVAGFPLYADLSNPCTHRHMTVFDPNAAVDHARLHGPETPVNPDAPYFKVPLPRPIYSGGRRPSGPEASELLCRQADIERAAQPAARVHGQKGPLFVEG